MKTFKISSRSILVFLIFFSLSPVMAGQSPVQPTGPAFPGSTIPGTYDPVVLDALVSAIDPDSLQSYIETLEAFPYRVPGTEGASVSRDWLVSKFEDFGYTSVLDSFFLVDYYAFNVLAYKEGATDPDKYIIIGAHWDAVPGSPGADDNGSGTAGVLELARIMQDIETNITVVFALFDAEEIGLLGSFYQADKFMSQWKDIIVMFNMDNIANGGSQVRLRHGPDLTCPLLYQELAVQLPSIYIPGVIDNNDNPSDHWSFKRHGWDVVYTLEYNISPHLHTPNDLSYVLDFNYCASIVRGVMATALVIDEEYALVPGLDFSYPDDLPEQVPVNTAINFRVQIDAIGGGELVSESAVIHYSAGGGPEVLVPLTELGAGLYEAALPAKSCLMTEIEFYISAEETGGQTFYDPVIPDVYTVPISTGRVVVFEDDFESDRGWAYDLPWERGAPLGLGGYGGPCWENCSIGYSDPVGGYNSVNCIGFNLAGNYQNQLYETPLTSPAIDCSNLSSVRLKFMRWLGVQVQPYDFARVRISNDGSSWSTVWENESLEPGGEWIITDLDISAVADSQSTVFVRFVMGNTSEDWAACGWNIDDLEVSGHSCMVCGDGNSDSQVNVGDAVYLINHIFHNGPAPIPLASGDANCDSSVNVGDAVYLVNYIFREDSPMPCAACP